MLNIKKIDPDSSQLEKIAFYFLQIFLFSLNFSIAVCNIVFAALLIITPIIFYKKKIRITLPKFYKYLITFILFTGISTIFSIYFINSLKDYKEIFIYLLIPVILIILDNKQKISISLYTLLTSAFLSALAGIFISLINGVSLQHRLKGFTSHWMTYSGLLTMVFVFFFIYSIYQFSGKKRIINLLLLTVIFTAIILSLTRSAWVGIFISLGIFILYSLRQKPLILLIPTIFLLIVFLVLPGSIKKRIKSIFDMNNVTNLDRIHMIYTSVEIVKDYPFTGVGPDNVKEVYPQYRHPKATKNNPHLHNNFLQIAAERGLPALIIFIIFILSVYLSLFKKTNNSNRYIKNITLGVIFLFTTFLISGLFEYNFGDSEIKFMLFFFLTIPFLSYKDLKL